MTFWDWAVALGVVLVACAACYALGLTHGEADMLAAFQEFGCLLAIDPTEGTSL